MSDTYEASEQHEALVHIVDDDGPTRNALALLLQSDGQMRVQTYATGEEFLKGYEDRGPGCLVVDMLNKLGMSGVALLRTLRDRRIAVPAIIVTAHPQWQNAVDVMKLGAFDYLSKPVDAPKLVDLVRRAIQRERENRAARNKHRDTLTRLETLSEREHAILTQILDDKTSTEIATVLGISPKTVEFHRANILRRMDVKSTIQLVRRVSQVSAT